MPLLGDPQTQYGRRDAAPALKDVEAAIRSVNTLESHAFQFRPEVKVRLRAHIQGIARIPHAGEENWFVMSKHHHDDPAMAGLLFVQWPGQRSDGSAFYAARSAGGPGVGQLRSFWGRGRSEHPGGMQLCGHILAVAHDPKRGASFVSFVDVSDPQRPSFISKLTFGGRHGDGKPTGLTCVALTHLADQHYLLFAYKYSVSNDKAYRGWFFRSNEAFLNQNSSWTLLHTFDGASNSAKADWGDACDNMALLNQTDGCIYLVGLRGHATDNHLDVYKLAGDAPALEYRFTKSVRTRRLGATLRAGGCLHVTPEGKLVIYAVEKAGGGPVRKLLVEEFSQ